MTSPAEDYLEKNTRDILFPLIQATLNVRPEDPIPFMIEFLKIMKERPRIMVNQPIDNSTVKNENGETKLFQRTEKKKVSFKETKSLVVDKSKESENKSESEEDDEDQDKVHEEVMKMKQNSKKLGRLSVSAEAYGKFNQKRVIIPKVVKKTSEQIQKIKDKVMQSFLFNSLEEKDLTTVINAMEERRLNEGEIIIQQGDIGDVLYLVDSGILECYKTIKKEEGPKFLKQYSAGEAFGELALMYNVPRAASVKSKTKCVLWSLDRETFNNIVRDASKKKREIYEKFIKSVDIFSTIDPYELSQVCEALQPQKCYKGDYIIKQNDEGDRFFILEEGQAIAVLESSQPGKKPIQVKDYKVGDYFGELALIRNVKRQASVIAKTDCKLLSLDRMSFKRLLGPIEKILERNSDTYTKYMKK